MGLPVKAIARYYGAGNRLAGLDNPSSDPVLLATDRRPYAAQEGGMAHETAKQLLEHAGNLSAANGGRVAWPSALGMPRMKSRPISIGSIPCVLAARLIAPDGDLPSADSGEASSPVPRTVDCIARRSTVQILLFRTQNGKA